MSPIQACPHCRRSVFVSEDGCCPACQLDVNEAPVSPADSLADSSPEPSGHLHAEGQVRGLWPTILIWGASLASLTIVFRLSDVLESDADDATKVIQAVFLIAALVGAAYGIYYQATRKL